MDVTPPKPIKAGIGVPEQVFEEFLDALVNEKIPPELVTRLRKALLDDKVFTERRLKEAILGEDLLP